MIHLKFSNIYPFLSLMRGYLNKDDVPPLFFFPFLSLPFLSFPLDWSLCLFLVIYEEVALMQLYYRLAESYYDKILLPHSRYWAVRSHNGE